MIMISVVPPQKKKAIFDPSCKIAKGMPAMSTIGMGNTAVKADTMFVKRS